MLVKMGFCVKLSFKTLDNTTVYAENEVPQPHVLVAFGLLKMNPRLSNPLLKSTSQSCK